ncbi:hypothetical protein [Mycolicibacterium holsaticum]|uniref:hypothetical protein n=1 Tax=Mycolicibacterium holsaticum TaxID=152142 RepID=UPI001C7D3397|nr:hypothetical protein [Mycolicibacterium holsaticum]QZA13930.1 hypothetical protein K3U96_07335 [Mycolicibacterium holsaticum DSM 44478 = JCM 12374]UNC08610.1 hypothetical protein H5U41_19495 [Mycolicibacterium holsaticum DSM 44478 = JCM 12374]
MALPLCQDGLCGNSAVCRRIDWDDADVQLIVIAVVGLVGTVLASTAVTEMLRRRDLRESIKSDLDIWDKLPDESTSKADLLRHIDDRVASLRAQPVRRARLLLTYIAVVFAAVAFFIVVLIQGGNGIGFRRDAEGVLRFYANESDSYTLLAFVSVVVGVLVGLGIYVFLAGAFTSILNSVLEVLFDAFAGSLGGIVNAPAEMLAGVLARRRGRSQAACRTQPTATPGEVVEGEVVRKTDRRDDPKG